MTSLDALSNKKKVSNISEIVKRPEIQKNLVDNKVQLSTDDIVDLVIHIHKYEIKNEESMKTHEQEEFLYMYFNIDGDANRKFIRTQSRGLREYLKAIPLDIFEKEDVVAVVCKEQKGATKQYYFSGTR